MNSYNHQTKVNIIKIKQITSENEMLNKTDQKEVKENYNYNALSVLNNDTILELISLFSLTIVPSYQFSVQIKTNLNLLLLFFIGNRIVQDRSSQKELAWFQNEWMRIEIEFRDDINTSSEYGL